MTTLGEILLNRQKRQSAREKSLQTMYHQTHKPANVKPYGNAQKDRECKVGGWSDEVRWHKMTDFRRSEQQEARKRKTIPTRAAGEGGVLFVRGGRGAIAQQTATGCRTRGGCVGARWLLYGTTPALRAALVRVRIFVSCDGSPY